MDDMDQLKQAVREGHRLVDLVVALQRQPQAASKRSEELEKQFGGCGAVKVDEPNSMRAEKTRQEARGAEETPA